VAVAWDNSLLFAKKSLFFEKGSLFIAIGNFAKDTAAQRFLALKCGLPFPN
jgi:hypothetical protein